ncbi:MAG TPA: amidohydrolase [Acidimicrobiia bacterium]|nr:amidohydrolase [Acidimicrobiia bacterium]
MPATSDLAGLVEEMTPHVVELRRLLHRHPEPSHHEYETTDRVRRFLEGHGLRFQDRESATGGWVDIGASPRVGFRADLDALPITEPSDHPHRSENEGWMHACGHDAHTAIAAGIAVILHRLGPRDGVRVIFQPAEESNPGGARDLVSEGVVDALQGLLAFHVDPGLPVGRIGARSGPITASGDTVSIVVSGPGGHTSRPHKTVDLVSAAGRLAAELPGMIRKAVDARSPLVVVFGSIHGGDAANVIPTEVVVRGTVRTLDPTLWDLLPSLVDKAIDAVLAPTGAGYSLEYRQGIAPVVNDQRLVEMASRSIDSALGPGTVVGTETSMGGEDFSDYLTVTPGALLRLGTECGGDDLHSAGFMLDEGSITVGIHAGVAALLGLME